MPGTSESYFKTLNAEDVSAGQVAVTPEVQPIHGCAHHSTMRGNIAVPRVLKNNECSVIVNGQDLVISLPKRVVVGDVVHWTAYGA